MIKRHIYRREIAKTDRILNFIKIGHQYQWMMLDRPDLAKYFFIGIQQIRDASLIEKEVLIHELLHRFMTAGKISNYYNNDDLLADLDLIRHRNNTFKGGIITLYPNNGVGVNNARPGQAWVETYFDVDNIERHPVYTGATLNLAFSMPKILYVALSKLIKGKEDSNYRLNKNITVHTVRKKLSDMGYGPVYLNPVTYKIIFRQLLKPTGKIITDYSPNFGTKALAAREVGARYNPIGDFPKQMADDLGLELATPVGKHDIILMDNYFKRVDIDDAMKLRCECREMLLYVEHDQLQYARVKYKPTQIVKVLTKPVMAKTANPNYIFYFKDTPGVTK